MDAVGGCGAGGATEAINATEFSIIALIAQPFPLFSQSISIHSNDLSAVSINLCNSKPKTAIEIDLSYI